jgi:cation diffusion facilitator CzcD-associated flavoprotein CzcO
MNNDSHIRQLHEPEGVASAADVEMLIIGAGFAGLRMLVQARRLGLKARVLEAGDGVGGTWYWNRYPGARCDVLSADYSYSFSQELEQEWRWSERYATQPEILRYIDFVAHKFDLLPDVTLSTRMDSATYDERDNRWVLECSDGVVRTCRTLVMATGCLSTAKLPDIPGRDSFAGETYHTAYWPHEDIDFSNKTVGVIGTGSSGTQLIPIVARQAEKLVVFQRTPNFSIPARNAPITDAQDAEIKANYADRRVKARNSPNGLGILPNRQSALEVTAEERAAHYESQWETAGFGFILSYYDLLLDRGANDTAADFIRGKIADIVENPDVLDKVTPTGYPFGAKRPCVDSGYFETLNEPNVELIDVRTDSIVAITEDGVSTESGLHELDVLVFATGFDAMTGSLLKPKIVGRGGRTLTEKWSDGPVTNLGISTEGFPNFFFITGPGSPSLLSNVLFSIEQHTDWLSDLLAHASATGCDVIESSAESEREWTDHVHDAAAQTLYPQANSYYMGDEIDGKPRGFMPYCLGVRQFRRKCDEVAASGYEGFLLEAHRGVETAVSSGQ